MDVENQADPSETTPTTEPALRKGSLSTLDAVAQSIALLALVMGVALSTSLAAQYAGAAAPLAFLVVGLASLCLAYVVIRFTRLRASAGSVYTYITQGLGPHVGFVGGWLYGGAFVLGISFVLAIASSYISALFGNLHLNVDWLVIFSVLLVLLFIFAFFDVRISTRIQLVLAGLGVLAVLVLAVLILAQGGKAGISFTPLSPAAITGGFSGLFLASIFSFTAFIGFEAAAALGEETSRPRVNIPRAILIATLIGIVYYVFVTYAMSIGYGTANTAVWAKDQAPLDTLSNQYGNSGLATFLDLMVGLDAFVAALAGVNLSSRIIFSIGRDKGIPSFFSWTHPRFKSPWVAILFGLVVTLILGLTLGRSLGAFGFFAFTATIGSLSVLTAYILIAISWIVFAIRTVRQAATLVFDVLLPVIAILVCGATIYYSVFPAPPPPLNLASYIVGGWLVLGIIVVIVLSLTAPMNVSSFGKYLADER